MSPAVAWMPGAPAEAETLDGARGRVRQSLVAMAGQMRTMGMPRIGCDGQLIRPVAAYAAARCGAFAEWPRMWSAALAVQLAHEASLVHDDIVDGAGTRRGEPTLAAVAGAGAALVAGDHLLAWAYRMAARTASLAFADLFAEAVEATIAGEIAQGRSVGRALAPGEYERIARDKAGALLGCALAAPAAIGRRADTAWNVQVRDLYELGRGLGLLYQRLDDLLDYCPRTETGKPPLGDHAQRRWTWVMEELPPAAFGAPVEDALAALHSVEGDGETPIRRLLARLEADFAAFELQRADLLPGDALIAQLAADWLRRAHDAVRREEVAQAARAPVSIAIRFPGGDEDSRVGGASPVPGEAAAEPGRIAVPGLAARANVARRIRERVPSPAEWRGYMARNSRSFAFAARFFPSAAAEQVARVYAYCRVTDDLVDRADGEDAASLDAILTEWVDLSRRAYDGGTTGMELLDRAMGEMASAGVPFTYAAELAEGMRMDLRGEAYPTMDALRTYTYRVASVVGLWMTELFGVHDAATLRRAAALGHAMQLTNILRDVGEDARAGRLYLPADLMQRHGITAAALATMGGGGAPVSPSYAALLEQLMRAAEADYALALAAIPRLPDFFQRPVAVAAHVYRGIHGAIRRNGYDNLRLRARTTAPGKALLAARALWELRGCRRANEFAATTAQSPPSRTRSAPSPRLRAEGASSMVLRSHSSPMSQ
ncbi:squalene/phytoene synthase family protein [Longimicrobium sp.]|uniref:squalene/phytoene synthase family protein n=1 Tax=Longimicrobium sp. TaxID=2029185 RepID=UPI002CC2A4F8|nr:squalene/phytoene synthase family protein [Longimicrobium sp.]HSU14333.1 squalene/phytoene synthase family protein [Longimicrobium sp.]